MKNDTFITAHSGCDGTLQNSWSYISHALDRPFDYIEFDIRRNDKGKLVLAHDLESARSGMLLDEALKMIAPTKKSINFDLKEYFLEEDIISLAENNGIQKERMLFTGSITDPDSYNARGLGVEVFINPEELIKGFYDVVNRESETKLIERAVECGFKVLNVHYLMCDVTFLEMCILKGLRISAWTVDDGDVFSKLIEYPEIINITTNHSEFIEQY